MCVMFASVLAVSFAAGCAHLWGTGDVSKTDSAIETIKKAANQEGEHNLPWFPPPFIGRDENVSHITNMLLLDPRIRGVHITGAPAIGKSHLAVHVGYELVRHGVNIRYIDVSEKQLLDDPNENNPIFQSSSNVVNENKESTAVERRRTDLMLSWFSPQEKKDILISASSLINWARGVKTATTIILDNCDDVLQGAQNDAFLDLIQKLQKASKYIRFISTSRVQLTLAVGVEHFPLGLLGENSSSDLLKQVCGKFQVEELKTVADLVGHNPLGLRLAAKLARDVMTVNELIKNLRANSIKALSNEAISEKEKMQFIIETSIKYLENEVILCAKNISLFPGSFSKEAGESILSGCGVENAIDCLNTLTHKSLLEWYEVRGESRYRYHELVRDSFVATNFVKIIHNFNNECDGKQIFYEQYSFYFTTHLVKTLEECESELNGDCKYWIHFEEHNIRFVLTALFRSSPTKARKCHAEWVKILRNPTFYKIYGEHRVSELIIQEIDNILDHLNQEELSDFSLYVVLVKLRNLMILPGVYRVLVIIFSLLLMPKFRVLLQSQGRHSNSIIGAAGRNGLAFAASLLASTTPAFYTTQIVQSCAFYEPPIVNFSVLFAMIFAVFSLILCAAGSCVECLAQTMLFSFSLYANFDIPYFKSFNFSWRAENIVPLLFLTVIVNVYLVSNRESCVSPFLHILRRGLFLFFISLLYRVHLYSDIIFLLFPIILLSNIIILLLFVWVIGIRSCRQHKQSMFFTFLVSLPFFFVVFWDYPFFTLFFV